MPDGEGVDGAFVGTPASVGRSAPVAIPTSTRHASSASSFPCGSLPSPSSLYSSSPVSAHSLTRRSTPLRMKTTTLPQAPPNLTPDPLEDSITRSLAASRLAEPPPVPTLSGPDRNHRRMIYVPPTSPRLTPAPEPQPSSLFEEEVRPIEMRLGYLGPVYRHKVVHALERVYRHATRDVFDSSLRLTLAMADIHMDCSAVMAGVLYRAELPEQEIDAVADEGVRQILAENASFSRALAGASAGSDDDSETLRYTKLRKLVIGTATDWRAIALELFATRMRWDEMRADSSATEEEKDALARRILTVYAPLANQLGMWCVQSELEELAFEQLHPDECSTLRHLVGERLEQCAAAIENAKLSIERALSADPDLRRFVKSVCIRGRIKGIYSIFRKMQRSGKKFEEIFDLVGLRVRVEPRWDGTGDRELLENRSCYRMLELVHSLWEPTTGRVKDFLEEPKENGYSSLHTTVTTESGLPLEIQIRTERMHARAEFGRAAHWAYKDQSYKHFEQGYLSHTPRDEFALKGADSFQLLMPDRGDRTLDQEMILFKSHADFMAFQNREIRKNHVMVMSEGEVHELIPGSTILDLAFNGLGMTHADVVAASSGGSRPIVNGVVVPLNHKLSMSDVVGFGDPEEVLYP